MKKIGIALTALFAMTAVASAKEIVPAPVVITEVVKPVEVWRPSGNLDLQYRYYGQDELGSAEYGRVQFKGAYRFTPKDRLEFRIRKYNAYQTAANKALLTDYDKIGDWGNSSAMRLRYFYDQNSWLTHRVQYESKSPDNQNVEYKLIFEYKDYMNWTPEWFKNTGLSVQPYYKFNWKDDSAYSANILGMQLAALFDLPLGFSIELNAYPELVKSNSADNWDGGLFLEGYLYHGVNLFEAGPWALDLNFEGGVDGFDYHQDEKSNYSLYAMPSLELAWQRNENMGLYLGVAGEYRNWRYTDYESAREWTWQPQGYAGMRFKF